MVREPISFFLLQSTLYTVSIERNRKIQLNINVLDLNNKYIKALLTC